MQLKQELLKGYSIFAPSKKNIAPFWKECIKIKPEYS